MPVRQKRLTGGGTSKSSQSATRTSSNINHQTFTKLRNSILKFTSKIKLKMGLKRSIFGRILPAFAAVLRPLKRKPDLSALLSLNSPNRLCLRHSDGGGLRPDPGGGADTAPAFRSEAGSRPADAEYRPHNGVRIDRLLRNIGGKSGAGEEVESCSDPGAARLSP